MVYLLRNIPLWLLIIKRDNVMFWVRLSLKPTLTLPTSLSGKRGEKFPISGAAAEELLQTRLSVNTSDVKELRVQVLG